MKNIFLLAVISGFAATAGMAQTTTFDNRGAADDAFDDLTDDIDDAAERDIVIGNEGRQIGTYGSVALRATSTSNDGDTSNDVGVGLRYGSFDGVNGFDMNFSYSYSDDNGDTSQNRLLAGIDYRRDFTPRFFAYGQGDLLIDNLTTTPGEITQDIFLGAGLGYRIYNTPDLQWSIQAGPGYRFAEFEAADSVDEVAASVSNNVFYSLSDTVYITNDTDVIYSETSTTLSNDLAVNVSMTDTLALRTSYSTRFNDQTDDDFADGENTFGLSLVYNFN